MATAVDTKNIVSVFDITGAPSPDFIQELSGDTRIIKKSEIFFALLCPGLPGEPDFGVGISDLIGETNALVLKSRLEARLAKMPDYVENVKYNGSVVQQVPSDQYLGVDLRFTESESAEEVLVPIGFSTRG